MKTLNYVHGFRLQFIQLIQYPIYRDLQKVSKKLYYKNKFATNLRSIGECANGVENNSWEDLMIGDIFFSSEAPGRSAANQ